MKVLMIGVDKTSIGGMLTVAENYQNSEAFCRETNLIYTATVIRANKWTKITTFLRVLPGIARTIAKESIDIVHVHMGERGSVFREGLVVWIARRMGVKTVIHMHGATIEAWYKRQRKPVQRLSSYLFCQADRMLVLGNCWRSFMEQAMNGTGGQKIRVLYNAVETPEKNRYCPDSRNILFYGVLVPRKGIDELLQAFRMILDEIPEDVQLTFYGADLENNIDQKIRDYHLEGRAAYCGWLDSEDRERCFSETMLNILPSYYEGLPMTVLESMAYGIPNIATNIAAIPEAVEDRVNGRLVSPGAVKELADAMKELILDRSLRMEYSENAFETIRTSFSIETHLERLLGIYRELLG